MRKKRNISELVEIAVKNQFKKNGVDKVVAGISGGADSTALLLALTSADVEVLAVHCNFHLRGEESMRDQKAVELLCGSLGVPLKVVDYDVEEYMRDRNISVEMACRDLRYNDFRRIMAETGAQRIVLAHNADDNVETLLLNLFRGSGITGLRGMLCDTGELMRPMLNISRSDIEKYLAEKGVAFVVDSTNLESGYRRNFLRNDVIPLIEKRWPGAKKTILTTIENLQTEERVLKWVEKEMVPDGDFLSLELISNAPDPFWIIYRFASAHGATRDISLEIHDVFLKKGGCQTIVGKSWKSGTGRLFFSMKGLNYVE